MVKMQSVSESTILAKKMVKSDLDFFFEFPWEKVDF